MRLTTSYRQQSVGLFTGTKHHYLTCRVDFTHEERAIIEERGLYDLYTLLPPAGPAEESEGRSLFKRIAGDLMPEGFLPGPPTEQAITLRDLLTSPYFQVHAYTLDDARRYEVIVREQLQGLMERVRDNAEFPDQTTYEI